MTVAETPNQSKDRTKTVAPLGELKRKRTATQKRRALKRKGKERLLKSLLPHKVSVVEIGETAK